MSSDLTIKQRAVLGFIRKCHEEDNRGPTIREVAMFAAGNKNSSSGMCHLNALEEKGYITRSRDNLARGITLVNQPAPNREKALVKAARALLLEGIKWDGDLGDIENDGLRDALEAYKGFTT